jgi:hypothetical protein
MLQFLMGNLPQRHTARQCDEISKNELGQVEHAVAMKLLEKKPRSNRIDLLPEITTSPRCDGLSEEVG